MDFGGLPTITLFPPLLHGTVYPFEGNWDTKPPSLSPPSIERRTRSRPVENRTWRLADLAPLPKAERWSGWMLRRKICRGTPVPGFWQMTILKGQLPFVKETAFMSFKRTPRICVGIGPLCFIFCWQDSGTTTSCRLSYRQNK